MKEHAPHPHYFKRTLDWNSDVVPRSPEWGNSVIFFETSEEGFVNRQIQLFESGLVLTYDDHHYHDAHGWRDQNPVATEPPNTVTISRKEFQKAWLRHKDALNQPRRSEP